MTDTALLALVETALESLLTGGISAYSINGRQFTKLDLPELNKMRKELQASVAAASSGMFYASQFRNPE
jgi:hypothetical protein